MTKAGIIFCKGNMHLPPVEIPATLLGVIDEIDRQIEDAREEAFTYGNHFVLGIANGLTIARNALETVEEKRLEETEEMLSSELEKRKKAQAWTNWEQGTVCGLISATELLRLLREAQREALV